MKCDGQNRVHNRRLLCWRRQRRTEASQLLFAVWFLFCFSYWHHLVAFCLLFYTILMNEWMNGVPYANPMFFLRVLVMAITVTQNVAWMKRQFSACQTPRRMYPSIFNSFPVIRTASAKNRCFHIPQPTFLFPLEMPLRLSRNMLHGWKDNRCLPNPSQHVPIYLQ